MIELGRANILSQKAVFGFVDMFCRTMSTKNSIDGIDTPPM